MVLDIDQRDAAHMDIDGIPPTVPRVLRERAELGDKKLLVTESAVLTYAQAQARSADLAKGLLGLGVGRGTQVGLLYPNGPEFVVATFALARIGAVSLPFSTMSSAHELGEMLRSADVAVLIGTSGYRSHDYLDAMRAILPELAVDPQALPVSALPSLRHVFFGPDLGAAAGEVPEPWRLERVLAAGKRITDEQLRAVEDKVTPADRLVIVHTSGSTSEPKAVMHTHGSILRHMRSFDGIRRYDADEVLFSNSPFFWVGGYATNLMSTLQAGATLVCSNARDGGETLDLIERERPTLLNGYAQSVVHLAEHPSFAGRDLSFLRRGNLYPIMPIEARPKDPELRHNMLGSTEAGTLCLVSGDESDQPEHRRGSFGQVAPGFQGRIMDAETHTECPAGTVGELQIRGPFLMEGYYGRERRDTFDPDGWYATGDLVRKDAEGFYYFLGRRNEMIKTAGANVSPREVEDAIHDLTGLQAFVAGVTDSERGQIVAAAVVTADPAAFDTDDLRGRLARRLSTFKVPRRIEAIRAEDVPIKSSGKIDLFRLKELLT